MELGGYKLNLIMVFKGKDTGKCLDWIKLLEWSPHDSILVVWRLNRYRYTCTPHCYGMQFQESSPQHLSCSLDLLPSKPWAKISIFSLWSSLFQVCCYGHEKLTHKPNSLKEYVMYNEGHGQPFNAGQKVGGHHQSIQIQPLGTVEINSYLRDPGKP